jgi:hypothetical protein
MKPLVRIPSTPLALVAAFSLAGALGCGGCGKAPPEPAEDDAAARFSGSVLATAGGSGTSSRLPRDDAGHLIPRSLPPPDDSGALRKPNRDPDWALESDDPARDYVRRYVLGTKRYGDTLDCIEIAPSAVAGDRRRVEVKNAAGCAAAGVARDVFLVDVGSDHLYVDDKSKRDPLARWPDGSDPEGPAGPVREMDNLKQWRGPLKETIQRQLLVPIRVQTYGRGTYPVVTIAGWHGDVTPTASPEALHGLASRLCKATGGAPMAFFAGVDRSRLLRIRCPSGDYRWDTM